MIAIALGTVPFGDAGTAYHERVFRETGIAVRVGGDRPWHMSTVPAAKSTFSNYQIERF
jgi:predicted RecA/RadA family phage recombinase